MELMLIGISVLLLLCTLAGHIWISVRKMMASPCARKSPEHEAEILACLAPSVESFLASEAFRFAGAYAFHNSRFGIWIRLSPDPPLRTFGLIRTFGQAGTLRVFETAFSDAINLATTIDRSAFLFPRLFGRFLQSFPRASIEQLWEAHLNGEAFILSRLPIQIDECRLPFLDSFQRDVVGQLSYVRSLPWWPVRTLYWYLVKRFLLLNRPIWNQKLSETYGLPGKV